MRKFVPVLLTLAVLGIAQPPDLTDADLVKPAELASHLKDALVLQVGFNVLYRASHIPGTDYAGPGSKPEGIELLKKAVEGQPHNRAIVLYCGCCPWEKCPNIRPAVAALHEMGFTNVKAVVIPENFKTDWVDKGYPNEKPRQ
jgi:thiosulfate/3-mercaptopyruvate sulfurtransferase